MGIKLQSIQKWNSGNGLKTQEGRRRAARADWALMMPQESLPRVFLVVAALVVVLEVAHVRTAEGWVAADADTGDALAKALKDLKENAALQELDLDSKDIDDEDAQALADALIDNQALQKLYLLGNQVQDAGAEALARALRENAALQELHLVDNQIGDKGAQALADALILNKSLQKLDLWGNEVQDAGAEALARALKENTSLQVLDLGSNQIGAAVRARIGNDKRITV